MAKQKRSLPTRYKIWMILGVGFLLLLCLLFYVKMQTASVSYMFIQNAKSAQLVKQDEDTFLLILNDVSPSTVYFSDRPSRIKGSVDTQEFISYWSVGRNNFQTDPPNASLISTSFESATDSSQVNRDFILVLSNPHYDPDGKKLTYTIRSINNEALPTGTYSNVSLFIDTLSSGQHVELEDNLNKPNGGINTRYPQFPKIEALPVL